MLQGVGILITFALAFVGYLAYSAYTQLPTATSGAPLTSTMWNNTITQVNQLGTDLTTLSGTVAGIASVPSGVVEAFNLSSCPTGWKLSNGTNGTVDLRGEFVRGLDGGRGIDSGRSLGTTQAGTSIPNTADASNLNPLLSYPQNADAVSAINQGSYVVPDNSPA